MLWSSACTSDPHTYLHIIVLHELSEDAMQLLSQRLELEEVAEHHHLCTKVGEGAREGGEGEGAREDGEGRGCT